MSDPTRVLLWTDTPAAYEQALAAASFGDRVIVESLPRTDMPTQAQRADVQVLIGMGAPAGILSQMTGLRWIQSMTAGVDGWLALPDLPAHVTLTCARGTHRQSMHENIVGALFHLSKPYAAIVGDNVAQKWVRRMSTPLVGKTLGILGLGVVGQDVAHVATALGMRVIGTKRNPTPLPGLEVLPPERTDEVLAQADFLLLLLPATPATDSFINAERLAKMKKSAWLLNFGRGHLVNDADLIAAVKAKQIAGAVLDVFRQEPLPAGHPLWGNEGIMILPHIGGGYPNRDKDVATLFVENLRSFLDGKPMKQVVDREAGY